MIWSLMDNFEWKYGYGATLVKSLRKFPDGFLFGISSASYQIEGAWNAPGKGESIWDHITHHKPDWIDDKSNGDIACDSYHKYKRDVEILNELDVKIYRFSISWARLCPTGLCVNFSTDGLNFYNNLINELILNGIQPAVTLYHWDLPQKLQDIGGWTNPVLAQYFEWYAQKAFEKFGDRVKLWLTFNEPRNICLYGYAVDYAAPALNFNGVANYLCVDTYLKAHARVYRLYEKMFRDIQHGRVGLTFSSHWYEPADNTTESVKAADIFLEFETGMYAHPIFGKDGDYPEVVRKLVDERSSEEGLPVSRLPELDKETIRFIKGTSDFIGVNHYTTKLTTMASSNKQLGVPSYENDHRVVILSDPKWVGSALSWLKIVPWGLKSLLKWINDSYDSPEIIIFENGYADNGELNDTLRVKYLRDYLNVLLDSIEDGCNVTGYMAWTLMDNFEWRSGYRVHMGLYHVDFNDPNRTRTPKQSAGFYKNVIRNHGV